MDQPENTSFIKSFLPPFIFVVLLWLIKWVEIAYDLPLYRLGVLPRELNGLLGIITSPFIHGDLKHLLSNTSPVLVLSIGIFYFYRNKAWAIIGLISIFSGLLIWIFARGGTYHIGASGLIYGFAFFLFFSGIIKKIRSFMAIPLLIIMFYGSMLWGILPGEAGISWEAHLFGAITGSITAFLFRKHGPQPPEKPDWHDEDETSDMDDPHISDYKKMPLED
ncbi:MAG: rhomboid family intramembrane serine protease [Bacteroidia bacterium]